MNLAFQGLKGVPVTLRKFLDEWDAVNLSLTLTLFVLIFHSQESWDTYIPIRVLCIAGLLYRPLCRRAGFWLAISILTILGYTEVWFVIDNHKYLILYWCLALCFSFLTPDPDRAIASNAKILIGLTFLFAFLQKSLSKDYINGSFFHYALLVDDRFKPLAQLVGNISKQAIEQNYEAFEALFRYKSTEAVVELQYTPQLLAIAKFLVWWTWLTEWIVAAAFLFPKETFVSKWRDVPLLLFVATTYSVANVTAFGSILLVMGTAQCMPKYRYLRLLYALVFLLLPLFEIPWMEAHLTLPLPGGG
jgi:hypothetical protein